MSFKERLPLLAAVLILGTFGFVSTEIAAKAARRSATVWYGLRLPSSVFEAGSVRSSDDSNDQTSLELRDLNLFSWNGIDETDGVKSHLELDARRALIRLTSGSVEIGRSEVKISGTAASESSESIVETLRSKMPAGYRLTANITSPDAAPYIWSALRSGDTIELSGGVPNEAVRRRLVAAAGHLVNEEDANAVIDRLSIRQGAPADFAEASFGSLQQLRTLDEGVVSLTGESSMSLERQRPQYVTNNQFAHKSLVTCRGIILAVSYTSADLLRTTTTVTTTVMVVAQRQYRERIKSSTLRKCTLLQR